MSKPVNPWSDAAKNLKPGRYRHFKGGEYDVLGIVRHSETQEELVLYRSLKDPDRQWVRPLEMFVEDVKRDGYEGPRFTYISSE